MLTVKWKVALILIFSLLVLSQVVLKQENEKTLLAAEKENETLKSDGQEEQTRTSSPISTW